MQLSRLPHAPEAVALLRQIDAARVRLGVSKVELARRCGIDEQTAQRALAQGANASIAVVVGMARALGLTLKVAPGAAASGLPDGDLVRSWLVHYGAPLVVETGGEEVPPPELVLAEGVALARSDVELALALPVAFFRQRQRLDFIELRGHVKTREQERAFGFFLELTGELSGDTKLTHEARRFRPERRSRPIPFFAAASKEERKLSEERTPDVARRWLFLMDVGIERFEAAFREALRGEFSEMSDAAGNAC